MQLDQIDNFETNTNTVANEENKEQVLTQDSTDKKESLQRLSRDFQKNFRTEIENLSIGES